MRPPRPVPRPHRGQSRRHCPRDRPASPAASAAPRDGPAATCPRPSGDARCYLPRAGQEPGAAVGPGAERSCRGPASPRSSAAALALSPGHGPRGRAPGPLCPHPLGRAGRPGVRGARPPRAPGAAAVRGPRGPGGARALFDVEETDHRGAAIRRAPMEFKCQQV